MSKSRKSSRRGAIHIDLGDICYDTTCVTILPEGLPVTVACDVYKGKFDIHTKKSSKKSKKERQKHASNRCKQYWISKWETGVTTTQGKRTKHVFTIHYLNISQDITIDYDNK